MPGAERAEIYFIAAMMVLILILSIAAGLYLHKTVQERNAG
jgi:hypothetical protein